MMQCVFEACGKNGFFHLEKYNAGIQPDINAYSDSAAKKKVKTFDNILKQKGNTILSKLHFGVQPKGKVTIVTFGLSATCKSEHFKLKCYNRKKKKEQNTIKCETL